ncbi:hypothetical protein PAP_08595 [Palaeococcus pacificus DY20341]|uniref:Uncharacterized protein n=2 Tax=Palaeococcus TaxID=83867 RepID=A0A075LTS0_9EURY|nr:hypothetical protein PAP_08595 [Palaeococcus pacificus DY20341]
MPGPYFPTFYGEMTRTDYLIVAFWAVLLVIMTVSVYLMKKNLDAIADEMKEISAVAQELRNESEEINKILEEV